jgi:ferredoxin
MCELCHQHGEGEKWYLRAENYAEDLLSDLRRSNYIKNFFRDPQRLKDHVDLLDTLNRMPAFVQAVLKPAILNRGRKYHHGQVLPIEDVEKIFGFVNSVVRLPCICRQASLGTEQRYCYGLSMVPAEESRLGEIVRSLGADYLTGPEVSGLETVSKEEALEQFKELEKKSLFHSVWTFVTPFIGGICNCDRDCMAMKATTVKSYPVMYRAEYVAETNHDLCNGCRRCISACQFGAISFSLANEKVTIDPLSCFGCGVCRVSCTKSAITLTERGDVSAAAGLW